MLEVSERDSVFQNTEGRHFWSRVTLFVDDNRIPFSVWSVVTR